MLPFFTTWWLYPFSVVLISSRQRALSNLLHESAHNTAAENAKINLALGTFLSAYPIFQTHYGYKRSHVATHHPKLGDPERDPDLKYFIEQGVYGNQSRFSTILRLVILPAVGSTAVSHIYFLFRDRILKRGSALPDRDATNEYWTSRMTRDKISFITFWAVALIVISLLGLWLEFLLFWIIPYLTVFQVLGWYIELSEHTPMVKHHNVDLYMTRNRLSRGIEKFLTGTYADHHHLDHHLDVRTPYWNLKHAHAIRMADPDYACLHSKFGGLFTKGPDGQPSALSNIIDELPTSVEYDTHTARSGQ